MNKKTLTYIFIIALLASTVTGYYGIQFGSANFMPETPPAGIQIAADGTVKGTHLIERSGSTYTLTGDIKGSIVILCDDVVLDGAGYKLEGSGSSVGVFLQARSDVTVTNMKIANFEYGIKITWLYYVSPGVPSGKILTANTLTDNTYGIYINDYSSGNKLSDNTLSGNTYGINLGYCYNNVLRNNRMDNNEFNFYVSGATTAACNNEIDPSNTINGAPIIYWVGEHGKTVPQNAAYVGLVSCTDITVQNLNLAHNGQSLLLAAVTNSKITNNTLTDNRNGIWLIESANNQIEKNTLTSNVYEAIYITGSYNNSIVQNSFTGNGITGMPMAEETGIRGRSGLRLYNSSNNELANNRFTGNGEGINLHESDNNTISANTLEKTLGSNINLFMSESNLFRHNTLKGNDCAMRIWSSPKNTIEYNQISNNSLGILLDQSAQNIIVYNDITDNRGFGMQLKSPSALLGGSQNNTIHHNNFINNQAEGLDVSIPAIMGDPHIGDPHEAITLEWVPGLGNVWDDGKEGNYWSDYTTRYPEAAEAGNSGTGNTAFVINENNQDNHPLMAPTTMAIDEVSTENQTENGSSIPQPVIALAIAICIGAIAVVLVFIKRRGIKPRDNSIQ